MIKEAHVILRKTATPATIYFEAKGQWVNTDVFLPSNVTKSSAFKSGELANTEPDCPIREMIQVFYPTLATWAASNAYTIYKK